MQDNEKKPALRFKGFTDPWEQRKLAELTKTITTGKSVNSDEGEVSDGNIGVLKTSCVSYDRFNPSESKPVVMMFWNGTATGPRSRSSRYMVCGIPTLRCFCLQGYPLQA